MAQRQPSVCQKTYVRSLSNLTDTQRASRRYCSTFGYGHLCGAAPAAPLESEGGMASGLSTAFGRDRLKAHLRFETNFSSPEMKAFLMPVEVRNAEFFVVGRATAPGSLVVDAQATYYVLARLPAGQEMARVIQVEPDEVKSVLLAPEPEDLSALYNEVSHYFGLPTKSILPSESHSTPVRKASPVVVPQARSTDATSAISYESVPAPPFMASLESLDDAPPASPDVTLIDPIETLLAEYASASSVETRTIVVPESLLTGIRPEGTSKPKADQRPIDLYLRLFRGSALALQARALASEEWTQGFHEGTKGRLIISGVNELCTLQVIQSRRPVVNIMLPVSEGSSVRL